MKYGQNVLQPPVGLRDIRHDDIQHNNTQHNDTQHNGKYDARLIITAIYKHSSLFCDSANWNKKKKEGLWTQSYKTF